MVYICVRPENLKITTGETPDFNISGKVKEHVFVGSINKTIVELANGQEIKITTPQMEDLFKEGMKVNIYWKQNQGTILHTKEEQIYNLIENTVQIGGGQGE
jgi:spermidine/putrescine transport system ATP-binding protein